MMSFLRAPDDDRDWFGPQLEPYVWLTRLIIYVVLIIGGLDLLAFAALVYFRVLR